MYKDTVISFIKTRVPDFGDVYDVSEEFRNCEWILMFERNEGSLKFKKGAYYPEIDGVWPLEGFSELKDALEFLRKHR